MEIVLDQNLYRLESVAALVFYGFTAFFVVAIVLSLSHILGLRRHTKATLEPFESGIVSVGSARLRLSVHYFLVAILFVIFDLEAVFLFAWAMAFDEAGLLGLVEAAIFIMVLGVALLYLWRVGALSWGPRQHHKPMGRQLGDKP